MKKIYTIYLGVVFILFSSCSKEWLEKKQDIKLIVPTTLNDLDLLLNVSTFEQDGRGSTEMSSDEAEYTVDQFNALPLAFQRNLATWNVTIYEELTGIQNEWNVAYSQIQVCNVVLNGLNKIERSENNKLFYDRIKGTALYHRSRQFLNLAMTFCKYYEVANANSELGIPLKLTDDLDERIYRSTLEETYQRIVQDLTMAASILPIEKISQTHIAKGGAYALLARTLLYMDNFQGAKNAADSSYLYHNFIEDYNNLNSTASRPLSIQSKEMHIPLSPRMSVNYATVGRINQDLYDSYKENDLRKVLFFKKESDGKYSFKGHYRAAMFSGTSTPEVLLIGAESRVRLGDLNGAIEQLNSLLIKRFKSGKFIPYDVGTADQILDIILSERRKELLTRCLRWQDLKRLNRDPRYAKTLTRKIGDQIYSLPAGDPRYILPIPQFIINFNGITQND
ncbi:RagB/SusD family nutrient uptake outer membrane protein [Chryseobacterium sp. CKR4-1]|uniref:RagB/SusD family nutrient uptake outer membrane protein n=1 Tax=Chryseobacterium sp. CKR4-1 TaxID=3068896 RepID=UPI0027965EF6|nr:RagB/SusD family nutrient uptake outer membrane protein [Chryseobacterium sp. CKR4-1]MDQ1805027.1 RagB/SusD family nutrient uptake outer membrane protein [Chryseobacterium sp. CKR4-1]